MPRPAEVGGAGAASLCRPKIGVRRGQRRVCLSLLSLEAKARWGARACAPRHTMPCARTPPGAAYGPPYRTRGMHVGVSHGAGRMVLGIAACRARRTLQWRPRCSDCGTTSPRSMRRPAMVRDAQNMNAC